MCVSPGQFYDRKAERTRVIACRTCWQCTKTRRHELVGRGIAEWKTAAAASFMTLTYRNNDDGSVPERAKRLDYKDVQLYLKRLRFGCQRPGHEKGHKVRYLIAGEYGELKGRAHWHIIMFWQDGRPSWLKKGEWHEYADPYWPHGKVHYLPVTEADIAYVCKYSIKSEDYQSECHYSLGLGRKYFMERAQDFVDQEVPLSHKYSFQEVRDKQGVPRKFHMTLHTINRFVQVYLKLWYDKHPNRHPPNSTIMYQALDRMAQRLCADPVPGRDYVKRPPSPNPILDFSAFFNATFAVWDDHGVMAETTVLYDDRRHSFYCNVFNRPEGPRLWWLSDEEGNWSWESDFSPVRRRKPLLKRKRDDFSETWRARNEHRSTSSSGPYRTREAA